MYVYDRLHNMLVKVLDDFIESEHPREANGRFAKTASRKIAEHTLKHSGGSFNSKGEQPKTGYMVAAHPELGESYKLGKIKSFDGKVRKMRELVKKFKTKNKDLLDDDSSGKLTGTWIDSETGDLWLDVSENIADKKEAIKRGTDLGELAIWGIEEGEEIRTNTKKKEWK